MSDIIEKEGVSFVSFHIFAPYKDLTAAVSTRLGGISTGDFKSLNMSFSTGDDKEAVKENRRRYFNALGLSTKELVGCNQVHGVHIEQVTKKDCGRGVEGKEDALPGCDGLVTNELGVALTMNFADCTPLLFFDPVRKAIGLAHGGWRGTAGNIAGLTVEKMKEAFGSEAKDILAAIGPAMGPDRFEVGDDVIQAFTNLFGKTEVPDLYKPTKEGKYLFNMWEANRRLLLRAGLQKDHIEGADICTHTHTDLFFSYRKEKGKTGRHMAVMELH